MRTRKQLKTKTTSLNKVSLLLFALVLSFTSCMRKMSELESNDTVGFNGGFEYVQNNLPVNWQVYTQTTADEGNFTINFDTIDFKEGKQSLKYEVLDCSPRGGRFSPGISQEIPVAPGEEYLVKFWVKTSHTGLTANVSAVNAFNKSPGPVFASSEGMKEWQQVELYYKIPDEMEKLRIEISIVGPGVFYLDGIEIKKKT